MGYILSIIKNKNGLTQKICSNFIPLSRKNKIKASVFIIIVAKAQIG